jgi:DUF1680 family protein
LNNIIQNQTYVTGSNSDKEHFIEPGKISKYITGYTGETCNTYNMLKVTRHLFTWEPDVKYADYYERALYNHILGQQDPKTGMVCYFTPLTAGSYRVYSSRDSSFWCCVGSGFESQSKYGEAIYYHDNKGVFVNLFIPSTLNWADKGLSISQNTSYPETGTTYLTIEAAGKEDLSFYIRYPNWAVNGAVVTIDGKAVKVKQKPGSYICLTRKWLAGDKISITFPMSLRIEPTPDNPKVAALMYGPILLAGEMGTQEMKSPAPYHDTHDPYQYYDYDYHIPANIPHRLNVNQRKLTEQIKPIIGQPLMFSIANSSTEKPIIMAPYYEVHRERYVVYWDID